MSNTRIEELLTEIRDLQAETLELLQRGGENAANRTDMVFGNISRSRLFGWLFVLMGLLAAAGIFGWVFLQ